MPWAAVIGLPAAVFASLQVGEPTQLKKKPRRKKVQPPKPAYRKTLKGGY